MTTRTNLAALTLALGALAASYAAPATAAAPAAHQATASHAVTGTVEDLPRGADTTVPYVADGRLMAGGEVIDLPPSSYPGGSYYSLLGETAEGWAVAEYDKQGESGNGNRAASSVLLVTATSSKVIHTQRNDGDVEFAPDYLLGRHRTRILMWSSYEESTEATVLDLTGKDLAFELFSPAFEVLDFGGDRLLFNNLNGDTVRSWRVDQDRTDRVSTRVGAFADLTEGVLALARADERVGYGSLAHPARAPRWVARFEPVHISPNGNRVLGWKLDRRGYRTEVAQVRRARDGTLLATHDARDPSYFLPLTWETSRTFLVKQDIGDDHRLVRCAVTTAACEVASPTYASSISFAFENADDFLY
ncbi:MAG: hypothetical protein JWO76_1179 [Nocardioides sp.]|nr:hypothetical protein [Nocardioides sp.]